ncbi:MAG: CHAT domain-containing protein [Kofleriaceae bacterium]
MSDPVDLHALTSRYFDGELEEAEHAAALEHLASCAQCQEELGDLVGLEVALRHPQRQAAAPQLAPEASSSPAPVREVAASASESSPAAARESAAPNAGSSPGVARGPAPAAAEPIPLERGRHLRARRAALSAALALTLTAAAVLITRCVVAPKTPAAPALALAEQRGVEVRFTTPPFDGFRPYAVARGEAGRESFTLEALAGLERRGDRAALATALALTGEPTKALAALTALPPTAPRDADLAAAELLAGRAEEALEAADRALAAEPALAPAHWNRALALRELGLPLAAAAALDEIIRRGEPGWADEARAKAAALRATMDERARAAAAFASAARAMVEGGPPLTAADAASRPGLSRLYFHDALRSAMTRAQARALAPLAEALDAAVGRGDARRAVDEVAASDFALRAPLAAAYRALATGTASESPLVLLDRLDRSRARFGDLRLGALFYARALHPGERRGELAAMLEATEDPWFKLYLPVLRSSELVAADARDQAEEMLRSALATCDRVRWGHRCAGLAVELKRLYEAQTRYREAETYAELALTLYRDSGATSVEDEMVSQLAELRRGRGRFALASATFQEAILRIGDRSCSVTRFITIGQLLIAVYRTASLRGVVLAPADACDQPPAPLELSALVDLARMTGRAEDRARAQTWLAAAHAAADPELDRLAAIAEARLQLDDDPGATAKLRELLPTLTGSDETSLAFRAWIYQSIIDDAARRGAWTEAVALAAEELGAPPPQTCALVVSLDDTRGTAVALDAHGAATGARARVETPPQWSGARLVPDALRAALRGCPRISVLARPPLHGRADLLPPELPWAFWGQRRAPAAPAAAAQPTQEVFVGDALPPASVGLPALAPMAAHPTGLELRGAEATPSRVLAALQTATYAELHVHGQVDIGLADASFLALSPGADQSWALTATQVRAAQLRGAPTIVLAACRAGATVPYEHRRWSLPDAFLDAGARSVIAPTVEIPDEEATAFFAELHQRLRAGEAPAAALAALRERYLARGRAWAAGVIMFD